MKRNRTLSLMLAVVLILSTAVIPINAESNVQYTEADLHEMISYADAVAAGHVNRLNDEEDMNTLIFANEDNTKTMYYYGENIKYTDENGTVRDKTNKLTYSNGVYVNEDNDINVAIPTSLSSGVTLTYEDIEIIMTPEFVGAGSLTSTAPTATLTSTSRGQADNVTYDSVFGSGISVRYTPMYSGVKEDIILQSYTGTYSFDFTIDTNGLLMLPDTVLEEAEAELDDGITDDDNATLVTPPNWYFAYREDPATPVAWLSDIYIYDSVGNTALGSVTVEQISHTKYALTVHADKSFLEAESTVYPVTVNPTITIDDDDEEKYHDATLVGQYPTSNYGSSTVLSLNGANDSYFAIRFHGLESNSTFTGLASGQIQNAVLKLRCSTISIDEEDSDQKIAVYINQYNPISYTSGVYWEESTATYSRNGVAYYGSSQYPQASKLITAVGNVEFDITNHVKEWADSSVKTYKGILCHLASADYTAGNNIASFYSGEYSGVTSYRPYLQITYTQDGIYKLVNVGTGKALNNSSGATINATAYSAVNDVVEQTFRVVYNSSENGFNIYALNSSYGYGKKLGQEDNDLDDVLLEDENDNTITINHWSLIYVSENVYWIRLNGSSTAYYLSSTSGGDVYLKNTYTSTNEQWRFEYIDDGSVDLNVDTTIRQMDSYSCSSACAQILLNYHDIVGTEESDQVLIQKTQKQWKEYYGENDWSIMYVVMHAINDLLDQDLYYCAQNLTTKEMKYYQILKSLDSGCPVMCIVVPSRPGYMYISGSTSHYVVISGIEYNNGLHFIIQDPNNDSNNTQGTYTVPVDQFMGFLLYNQFICSQE